MCNLLSAISKNIVKVEVISLIKSYLLTYFDDILYILQFFIKPEENYDVAVVRLDHIGDFILWLDSAKQLVEHYHGRNILLITSNINKDYASSLGYWSHVVGLDAELFSTNLLYRAKIILRIHQFKTNTVIHPVVSRKFYCSDSIVRALRARHKVGSKADFTNMRPSQKRISDAWYTELVDNPDNAVHELEKNSQFLKELGIGDGLPRVACLPVQALNDKLVLQQPYCVIFPGASWSGRQWSVKSFSEIANFAYEKYGLIVVLCGSAREWLLCEEIRSNIKNHQSYNFAGLTRVQDLVEVVRRSEFLISNETSAVHIAAAVGKKSICLVGGGHWQRFLPYPEAATVEMKPIAINFKMDCYQCNWKCKYFIQQDHAVPCIANITVSQVVKAMESLFLGH